jgi:potassium-dependent mechanosensitive channel
MPGTALNPLGSRSLIVASLRGLVVVALAGASFVSWGSAPPPTSAQPAPQAEQPAQPTAPPIPVPEIAQRAEDVATLLRQSAERLATDPEIQDVNDRLPAASEWIRERLVATTQTLNSPPSSSALANLSDSWMVLRTELDAWSDILTRRATQLERELRQFEALRATWSASRTEALASGVPAPLLERINATLAAIVAAREAVGAQRTRVLSLQDQVVKEIARCDDVLAKIARARNELVGPLFARDSLPIWNSQARTLMSSDLGQQLRQSLDDSIELTRQYLARQLARVPFQVALFVVVLVLARLARGRARHRAEKEPSERAAAQVFERPVASALVLALLAVVWIYPHPPRTLINAVGLLILLPAVLIVRRLASPAVVPAVYALAAFFLVDRVREVCAAVPVLEQWVFLLEMVFGILFLALAVRSEHLVTDANDQAALGWRHVLVWLLWGQLAILACAVFAGAFGYMRLARLLGTEVLVSSYIGLVLYAGVRVGEGLVAYLLRVRPLRTLFMVQQHRALLQRRFHLALRWVSVGTWVYFTLDGLGVMSPSWTAVETVLGARYVRGSVSMSVGDVVAFGLTIWAAFLLSAFVRFVLHEDVYPRVGLPRGLPYALSSLLHYAVILVGFIFAVAALGVDLTRITIVAGALGVGIGIGLQNVVANFVAGLILLLERRIHVGDSIETGDLQGEVRQIGFRSSTIRTWDGAEVIVPNGRLTSERVTNWTLSDRMRRVDLKVAVAYASDPPRVLDVLCAAAKAYPKVLAEPAALALCTGFRDSALNFELRVWAAADSDLVLSELAVAVHAALAAARIEIAFPQHDIHIRNAGGEQLDLLRGHHSQ